MSHFVRCDRCNTEDAVTGTLTLPPGWQKILHSDLCEPCCTIVREFIRFKPSDAEKLPVEPIPEEVAAPLEPAKDKLFETAPEEKPCENSPSNAPDASSTTPPTPSAVASADASFNETSTEERARTRHVRRKMRGQDAILPDKRKPTDPPQPGAQA